MSKGTTGTSAGTTDATVTETQEEKNEQAATANNEGAGGTTKKTFTQEEVNALLATEKRNLREKQERLRAAGLSEDEIATLHKKEESKDSEVSLKAIQEERVKLLLEKHSGVIAKLAPEQIQKLKTSNPDRVQEFLENLQAVIGSSSGATPPPVASGGELPPMSSGVPPANVSKEDLAMAEGIEAGLKTDDWSGVMNSLFNKL